MPFHTPITWTSGQVVTKDNLNEQIRDNINAIRDEDIVFADTVPSFFGAGKTVTEVLASPPAIGSSVPGEASFTNVEVGTDLTVGNDVFIIGDLAYVADANFNGTATANALLKAKAAIEMAGIATPSTPAAQSIKVFPTTSEHLYALRSDGVTYPLGPSAFWICKVYKTGTQSLTSGTAASINFDLEAFDGFTMHDNVTNNTRITVPRSGYYEVCAEISFAANATGQRGYVVLQNGAEVARHIVGAGGAGLTVTVAGSHVFYVSSGHYFEIQGYQNSGGALNVVNSPQSYFSVRWIGA